MAIEPFAPPMSFFKRGRDFTAFFGLIPGNILVAKKENCSKASLTAGKQILEKLESAHLASLRCRQPSYFSRKGRPILAIGLVASSERAHFRLGC